MEGGRALRSLPRCRIGSLLLTLPPLKGVGFLVPRSNLRWDRSRRSGRISPSVREASLPHFRVPPGMACQKQQGFVQDIECRVQIAIQDRPARAAVRPLGQRLHHAPAARGAVLAGIRRRNGHDDFAEYPTVVDQPEQKGTPRRVVNALGEMMVLDEVAHLQVFVGDQVVRPNERTGGLRREVFTPPGYLQML